jgi:hypothetical protein
MSNTVASNTSLLAGYTCNTGDRNCASAWASADCTAAVRYMCQLPLSNYECRPPPQPPPAPPPRPPPPASPPPSPCLPTDRWLPLSTFRYGYMCIRPTGLLSHDDATDYCDTNYNGATLPIIASKAQDDELTAAWTAYVGGNWVPGAEHMWLGYQLEVGTCWPVCVYACRQQQVDSPIESHDVIRMACPACATACSWDSSKAPCAPPRSACASNASQGWHDRCAAPALQRSHPVLCT